jgi:hypothetical protein
MSTGGELALEIVTSFQNIGGVASERSVHLCWIKTLLYDERMVRRQPAEKLYSAFSFCQLAEQLT